MSHQLRRLLSGFPWKLPLISALLNSADLRDRFGKERGHLNTALYGPSLSNETHIEKLLQSLLRPPKPLEPHRKSTFPRKCHLALCVCPNFSVWASSWAWGGCTKRDKTQHKAGAGGQRHGPRFPVTAQGQHMAALPEPAPSLRFNPSLQLGGNRSGGKNVTKY